MKTEDQLIYLDHHATTPLDPEVLAAMMPYLTSDFGNASSIHPYGWKAKEAVEEARKQVAKLIGAQTKDIYFTSGATESNNLALQGALTQLAKPGPYNIITTRIEHKSVLEPCADLVKQGHHVTYLEPDAQGLISTGQLEKAIRFETVLVSIQAANNEIGTIQNLGEIGKITRSHRVLFHTDAVQILPYISIDVIRQNIDMLTLSGHKMNGPKGVGAVYIRSANPRVKIDSQTLGAGQERGMRSGTLNVPGIVGLGHACKMIMEKRSNEFERIKFLRNYFEESLQGLHCAFNGDREQRLPNNMSVTFSDLEATEILREARDLAVSTGAACTSTNDPSHVLTAIGLTEREARGTLRFGLGRTTTREEIDKASKSLVAAISNLRSGLRPGQKL